jgi:hypothetical protein
MQQLCKRDLAMETPVGNAPFFKNYIPRREKKKQSLFDNLKYTTPVAFSQNCHTHPQSRIS